MMEAKVNLSLFSKYVVLFHHEQYVVAVVMSLFIIYVSGKRLPRQMVLQLYTVVLSEEQINL